MKSFKLKEFFASFYVYDLGKRSAQKIKLKIGESIEFNHFEYHEEGYRSIRSIYGLELHDGRLRVVHEYSRHSTDCDGPHEYHSAESCLISSLQAGPRAFNYNHEGLGDKKIYRSSRLPLWNQVSSSQRDYYAESMNY